MTDHFDALKKIPFKSGATQSEPLREGYKACTFCFKEILETAVKCKHCKRWLTQINKDFPSVTLMSLLSLKHNTRRFYSLAGLFALYLVVNFSIFFHHSTQGFGDNFVFLFQNAISLVFTYLSIVFTLFLFLKLFKAQKTDKNILRAQISIFFISLLVFYIQSYDLAENAQQNESVPEQGSSPPKILGVATSNPNLESSPKDYNGKPVRIPIQVQGNRNFIQAKILSNQTYKGKFLLDTGAEQTVIYQSFLDRHNLIVPSDAETIQLYGISGNTEGASISINLDLGGIVLHNVAAAVIDNPDGGSPDDDGIIGMNALKHFKFEIDRHNQILTLKQ